LLMMLPLLTDHACFCEPGSHEINRTAEIISGAPILRREMRRRVKVHLCGYRLVGVNVSVLRLILHRRIQRTMDRQSFLQVPRIWGPGKPIWRAARSYPRNRDLIGLCPVHRRPVTLTPESVQNLCRLFRGFLHTRFRQSSQHSRHPLSIALRRAGCTPPFALVAGSKSIRSTLCAVNPLLNPFVFY
jgi:hypothetical protein